MRFISLLFFPFFLPSYLLDESREVGVLVEERGVHREVVVQQLVEVEVRGQNRVAMQPLLLVPEKGVERGQAPRQSLQVVLLELQKIYTKKGENRRVKKCESESMRASACYSKFSLRNAAIGVALPLPKIAKAKPYETEQTK